MMDLINWKIRDESGALLATTQISISSNPNKKGSLYFDVPKSLNIAVGNYLLIEAPVGSPVYKVQVTATPEHPESMSMVQIQSEILPF